MRPIHSNNVICKIKVSAQKKANNYRVIMIFRNGANMARNVTHLVVQLQTIPVLVELR